MRLRDIYQYLQESYQDDVKRTLRDALVVLKIQKHKEIKTSQILKDFENKGLKISTEELITLLQNDPMVQSVDSKNVVLVQDDGKSLELTPSPNTADLQKSNINSPTVSDMASKAVSKRMR